MILVILLPATLMELDFISVRGAREHNLRDVDVDIPKHRLVIITGVSGSGKSSLAFDTLFAEGQRRYVESLSAYARQFLGQLTKPAYDAIRGLSPTIAIEQKTASMNPRSTVGTVTEIYDYLRVLFARAGAAHCPECGCEVRRHTPGEMVEAVLGLGEGRRFMIAAPLVVHEVGDFAALFGQARRDGFARMRVDGRVFNLDDGVPELDPGARHDIEVVIDRLRVRDGIGDRLNDSIEMALGYGNGTLVVAFTDGAADLRMSDHMRCDACGIDLPELSPQLLSFNSPLGMCPECKGLGTSLDTDADKLVPDVDKSLDDGAVVLGQQAADGADAVIARVGGLGGISSGSFAVNGVEVAVDIDSDTLQDVVDRINASGSGVRAALDLDADRIEFESVRRGEAFRLEDGDSGFLSAIGVEPRTYEPTGVVRSSGGRGASEAMRVFTETLEALFETSEDDGAPATLSSLVGDLKSLISDGIQRAGRNGRGLGLTFRLRKGGVGPIRFWQQDQVRFRAALRKHPDRIEKFFTGKNNDTPDGMLAKMMEKVDAALGSIEFQGQQVGLHLDTYV
ncbi:MAG: hypothetical protein CSA24_02665 [Deltaproteobacteria bacterium]|nr:MAG: hypothetical protein CSA24_02665 [Deltaproteobacteria bacterium]